MLPCLLQPSPVPQATHKTYELYCLESFSDKDKASKEVKRIVTAYASKVQKLVGMHMAVEQRSLLTASTIELVDELPLSHQRYTLGDMKKKMNTANTNTTRLSTSKVNWHKTTDSGWTLSSITTPPLSNASPTICVNAHLCQSRNKQEPGEKIHLHRPATWPALYYRPQHILRCMSLLR